MRSTTKFMVIIMLFMVQGSPSWADESQDLAKKLSNPVSSLISVPIQGNYDFDVGQNKGERLTFNVQPVIPISISEEWNLISRTILPITYQKNIAPGSDSQFGLGDTVQSLFFSPKAPTAGGIIWGAGPVFLLPTATDELLGAEKWGAGPTAVVLKQIGPWTIGMLANHLWSFAGNNERNSLSTTFMQPFISHTTPTAWTFSLNTEASYDWKADQWSVPINFVVAKMLMMGKRPISLFAGLKYWAKSSDSGPNDVGIRFGVTFLFPKK